MKFSPALPIVGLLFVGASIASAQDLAHFDANHNEFGVGVSAGYFLPSDTKIQSVLGKDIFKFGLDLGPAPKISDGRFGPSLAALSISNGGQNITVLAGMISYNFPIPELNKNFEPYVKAGLGGAYADYTFNYAGSHYAAKKLLPIAQLKAGIIFDKNYELSLAYDWLGSTDGFNFSGLNISLSYTVFRF